EASVVDFNRGGTPLVEIVSEPDLRSAADAAEWGRLLRATLKATGVSDVNMEEGSLRVDANVSIRPTGEATLGTKTELKNMNSFRFLERGIEAEIARQQEIVHHDGHVEQETLHFDPATGSLSSLRPKVGRRARAELVQLVSAKAVSQSAAKEVLDVLAAEGGSPKAIVEERSLGLAGADELGEIVDRAIEQNADAVEQIRAGKDKAVG